MSHDICGRIMPGSEHEDIDASIPEFRCQLPAGHDAWHAAVIEWNDEYPYFLERDAYLEREAAG